MKKSNYFLKINQSPSLFLHQTIHKSSSIKKISKNIQLNNKINTINSSIINNPTQNKRFTTKLHGHLRVDRLNKIEFDEALQQKIIKREKKYFSKWKTFIENTYSDWLAIVKKHEIQTENEENDIIDNWVYYYKPHIRYGYDVLYRKQIGIEQEELVFDIGKVPILNKSKLDKVSLKQLRVSDDHSLVSYILDMENNENTVGGLYKISSKEYIDMYFDKVSSIEFGSKAKEEIIILEMDSKLRPYKVSSLKFKGIYPKNDEQQNEKVSFSKDVLFETERKDDILEISKTKSNDYLIINSINKNDSEIYIYLLKKDKKEVKVNENKQIQYESSRIVKVIERKEGIKYFLDYLNGSFYLLSNFIIESNKIIPNEKYRVYSFNESDLFSNRKIKYTQIISPMKYEYFHDMQIFEKKIIVFGKNILKPFLISYSIQTKEIERISIFNHAIGEVTPSLNKSTNPNMITFDFTNPYIVNNKYSFDLNDNKLSIANSSYTFPVKINEFDYEIVTIQSPSQDGEVIPCTLFYKKGHIKRDRKNKLLAIAYGAYGLNLEHSFDMSLFAAVEKGWIVAYCHVRGGYELGEYWHEKGKLENKINGINDYISCIMEIIKQGYSHPNFIIGYGSSAGAIIISQSANINPSLFRAIILNHPFVDILSTLLNENYRLTLTDYKEFGNPILNEKDYLNILSWSPYENISVQEYPAIYITMSINDSRVASFGVLKYIEKMRLKALCPCRLPDYISSYSNICVQIEDEGHFGYNDYSKSIESRLNELAFADKVVYESSL